MLSSYRVLLQGLRAKVPNKAQPINRSPGWRPLARHPRLTACLVAASLALTGCGDDVIRPEVVSSPNSITGPSQLFPNVSDQYCAAGAASSIGSSVEYQFEWGDGCRSCWADTCPSIAWTTPGTYCVKARARSQGDRTVLSEWTSCYLVTVRTPPETISTPDTPTGPTDLSPAVAGEFCGSGATSSLGHDVEYRFDWADGSSSPWGASCQSHSWTTPGSYCVRAQARCAAETDMISPWSVCGNVLVLNPNEAISTPSTPTGPSKVGLGASGEFCTGASTSSKGHTVVYRFDWGNGARSTWGNPCRSYFWPASGSYCVMTQARCATDTTALSHWTPCKPVTVPARHTLRVASGNPDSGVHMKIESPGLRYFNTPNDTILEAGTGVTLTCPSRAGGHVFRSWTEDGREAADDTVFTFTMDQSHHYVAEYWALALCVDTDPPGLNAVISVSPVDDYGKSAIAAPGCLSYENAVSVEITAPGSCPEYNFSHWSDDGQVISTESTVAVVMTEDRDLVAVYEQVPTYVLTVTSNAPIPVSVSPADNNGNNGGNTTAEFVYNQGAQVTVGAAFSVTRKWAGGGSVYAPFVRWCPGNTAARTRTVVMTEAQTLHAVYPEVRSVTPASRNWCGWCCLILKAGDRDFGGHGPYVKFDLRVENPDPSTLRAFVWAWAREYEGNYPLGTFLDSIGEATSSWTILELPEGWSIVTVKTYDCYEDPLYVDYTPDDFDCSPGRFFHPCAWINRLCLIGESDGNDLTVAGDPCGYYCNKTAVVRLDWNPVEYLVIPAPCD